MKKTIWTNNRVFLFALILALIGALLLGTVLSLILKMGDRAETAVEREEKIGIYEDSGDLLTEEHGDDAENGLPTETNLPQTAETAEDAYAIVKHAAAALGCPALPEEYEVAYVEEREPVPGYIEPAHWVVSEALTGYGEEAETQPFRTSSVYKATVDPKTGRMGSFSCSDYVMQNVFTEWGTSDAADGEAILQEHMEYLDFAAEHIRVLYPSERNVRAKLKAVGLERGHLNVHVYVNTDADGIYMLDLMRKDGELLTVHYGCGPENWWDEADQTFTNYDAYGWWL